jgi:hypothetical protein
VSERGHCYECEWFHPSRNEEPLSDGVCIRFPPDVAVDASGRQRTAWPNVMDAWSCGEWTAKETSK